MEQTRMELNENIMNNVIGGKGYIINLNGKQHKFKNYSSFKKWLSKKGKNELDPSSINLLSELDSYANFHKEINEKED